MTTSKPTELLRSIFAKTLECSAPELLVLQALKHPAPALESILRNSHIHLFGAGKASLRMARGAIAVLGRRVAGGLVIIAEDQETGKEDDEELYVEFGTHPIPSEQSVAATEALLEEVSKCMLPDACIFLLSGGASALLEKPERGVTLEQIAEATQNLLVSGAPIAQLNAVRKALSAVKGGQLAARFKCPVVALVLSDVAGNDFATIGSGPLYTEDRKVPHILVGDGALFAKNAVATAEMLGVAPGSIDVSEEPVVGDVLDVARGYAAALRSHRGKLLVRFGEPTVTIEGATRGHGGRNQHLALAVARLLANEPNWAFLAAGSDGIDGNSAAAGACVDASTWAMAEKGHLKPAEALEHFDTSRVHEALGTALQTGPTGNNLQDLHLLWIGA